MIVSVVPLIPMPTSSMVPVIFWDLYLGANLSIPVTFRNRSTITLASGSATAGSTWAVPS